MREGKEGDGKEGIKKEGDGKKGIRKGGRERWRETNRSIRKAKSNEGEQNEQRKRR